MLTFWDFCRWRKKADARRKMAMELWAMLSEEVPEGMTSGEMWEQWGLEDDL